MNCTICGKSTLPGAMLCAPCKAALKRARYVTIQEDLRRPSVIDVRRQARPARLADAAPVRSPMPEADALPPAPIPTEATANARLARRIFVGVFVLAAVLGGASYFGQRELGARSHDDATASQATVDPMPGTQAPTMTKPTSAASPAATVSSSVSSSASSTASPAAAGTGTSAAPAAAAPNLPATRLAAANTGKRAMVRNGASFSTTNGDPPDAVPMPEPEKPQPMVAPPPPPAPDRWQTMRDAIAQCDREGLLDGIICGQKARIQYCAGYWGKVAQCPGPTVNPER